MERRETSETSEMEALREERQAQGFDFSISPFTSSHITNEADAQQESLERELKVRAPEEVPWTDLLLEISMTTAFASLTDGTPILETKNAISYVCYFAFVWWIWVSQVAYNMRFRQADILHRIWVFLQLAVFSALAAFTKDFDITTGLVVDPDVKESDRLIAALVDTGSTAAAIRFRQDRLPLLNARGLSMVMALSRLLLLAQYLVVFYHAKRLKRKSLLAQICPLVFSFCCYLGAFFALGHGNVETVAASRSLAILKIILWYLPILVELSSHYAALHLAGFVRYTPKAIFDRAGTVFLIILGAGLDKITGGFKAIIGNGGLGWDGAPLFVAASVLFIGFFALYFATPGTGSARGRKRHLTWFFAQFFFFSALIIALQCIATLLQFANLNAGITRSHEALQPLFGFLQARPNENLTASNFAHSELVFRKWGTSLDSIVNLLNEAATYDNQPNNTGVLHRAELQIELFLLNDMLWTLEAQPEPASLLWLKMYIFTNVDWDNTTELTDAKFWDIKESVIRERGSSGLWFYPATGATILALGLLPFIRGRPRDHWEWSLVTVRIIVGSASILTGFLDFGHGKPVYDETGVVTDSRIWRLILSHRHLQLILMAVVMGVLLLVEFTMAYFAKRSYLAFGGVSFFNGPEVPRPSEKPSVHVSGSPGARPYDYYQAQPQYYSQVDVPYNPYQEAR